MKSAISPKTIYSFVMKLLAGDLQKNHTLYSTSSQFDTG